MQKGNRNFINKNRRKLLSAASLASAGALLSPLLSKAAPSTILESGSNVDTASYIIFKDGSTIYAKNGTTGKMEFQNTDASTVIQNAIDALTSGGKIFIKKGTYDLTSGIVFGKDNYSGQAKATIIEGEGYFTNLHNTSANAAVKMQGRYASISNLQISGNNTNSGDGLVVCAYNDGGGGGFNNSISNIFLYQNNNGLVVRDAIYDSCFSNIRSNSNRANGILLKLAGIDPGNAGNYYPNANCFNDITASFNGNDGIRIEAGNSNVFTSVNPEFNGEYGFYINDNATTIINIYAEGNAIKEIYGDTYSAGLFVVPSNIGSAGTSYNNGNYVSINGNSIAGANATLGGSTIDYLTLGYRIRTTQDWNNKDFETWNGTGWQAVARMRPASGSGYFDILRGGNINMATVQTTLNGATTGNFVWSMPFQGSSYKRFIGYLNGYRNSAPTPQTITFPTAFSNVPKLASDDSEGASVSATTLTLPINMAATKTGWIIIEGY